METKAKKMKDLTPDKAFLPAHPAKESAELARLTNFLNASAGIVPPKEKASPASVALRETAAVVTLEPARSIPTQQTPVSPQAPGAGISKIFLTGRMKVGKDYILAQANFKIFALADPLYWLAEYFFDKRPKDEARTFLQTAGQWGRGTISAEYPLTPERAMFVKLVRETIQDGRHSVNWSAYGQSEDIWLDALVARVKAEPAGTRVAVSGVRFQNEIARLTAEGYVHFHVTASWATWVGRLKAVGLTPESAATRDISEQIAIALDANVQKQLLQQKTGSKLRCIWSDPKVVPPSGRLLSVADFCGLFPKT